MIFTCQMTQPAESQHRRMMVSQPGQPRQKLKSLFRLASAIAETKVWTEQPLSPKLIWIQRLFCMHEIGSSIRNYVPLSENHLFA